MYEFATLIGIRYLYFQSKHAAIECKRSLDLIWIEAAHLENGCGTDFDQEQYDAAWEKLRKADGVVVPGGFGKRYFCTALYTS
jgi:CTP synthase (UTP-ammonia lyase)